MPRPLPRLRKLLHVLLTQVVQPIAKIFICCTPPACRIYIPVNCAKRDDENLCCRKCIDTVRRRRWDKRSMSTLAKINAVSACTLFLESNNGLPLHDKILVCEVRMVKYIKHSVLRASDDVLRATPIGKTSLPVKTTVRCPFVRAADLYTKQ